MWILEQGLQESREQLAELRVQGVLQTEGRAVERETRTRGGRGEREDNHGDPSQADDLCKVHLG